MKPLPDQPQAVSPFRCVRNGPFLIRCGWSSEGEACLQLRGRPIGNIGRPDEGVALRCDAEKIEDGYLAVSCLSEPSIVGCVRICAHECIVDELIATLDLRVNRPLVIVPDARAGSRIDGPDAKQMLHGCWFEDTALGVDQRNSLAINEESDPQFFRCDYATHAHTFDVLDGCQSNARVERIFTHRAIRSETKGGL